jgi:deazaflavin-dependent oxidoreductase (nitroreductase family)
MAGHRWFRLWGVLHHVGRTSGREYEVPIVARRTSTGFVIPLPFGERTQWVKNVIARGGCTIRWNGADYRLTDPRVLDIAEVQDAFSGVQRWVIPRVGLRRALVLHDLTQPRAQAA